MADSDTIKSCVNDAIRLCHQGERVVNEQKSQISISLRSANTRLAEIVDSSADIRFRKNIASSFRYFPGVGSLIKHYERRLDQLYLEKKKIDSDRSLRRKSLHQLKDLKERYSYTKTTLRKALKAVDELGTPPSNIVTLSVTVRAKIGAFQNSKRGANWEVKAVNCAKLGIHLVRDWAEAKAILEAQQKDEEKRRSKLISAPSTQKIYLPIPNTLTPSAVKAGAINDPNAPRGSTNLFVTRDMDLSRFKDMLPLAYRPVPPKFEFPPVPFKAAGQNLWGLFEKDTWDHVRKSAYQITGRRCIICGGKGDGFIADKIAVPGETRNQIEAHEVWEWQVPDATNGVGIQKLKNLLVVCPNCHAMFHEAHARRMARENGFEDEVKSAIEKRRMLVNRMGRDGLAASVEAASAHLHSVAGIQKWVVDLSYLGNQQFMAHATATMKVDNAAGLQPEQIAGLAFDADDGRQFPSRSAAEIYKDLVLADEIRNNVDRPETVVPFRRR